MLLCFLEILEELVGDLFLAKEEKAVDVGQSKAVACFCHVDAGFGCAAVKSDLLKDFRKVFLPCFWTAA